MLIAEAAMLRAVRNKLRTDLSLADNQCDVELDDQVPAIAPDDYFAVTAGGIRMGPNHRSSGGVYDVLIDVRVTMFRRVPEVARDRRRNVFLDLLLGTALKLELVVRSLDNNYPLLGSAKAIVDSIIAGGINVPAAISANTTAEWPEPFRTFTADRAPRMVLREQYDAAQMSATGADPIVAISRGITFSGARYKQVR